MGRKTEDSSGRAGAGRAVRRAGTRITEREEPSALEVAESDGPMTLTAAETRRVRELQQAAERDPQAYMEAARANSI